MIEFGGEVEVEFKDRGMGWIDLPPRITSSTRSSRLRTMKEKDVP